MGKIKTTEKNPQKNNVIIYPSRVGGINVQSFN
jgi:hypothetical protein